MVDLFIDALNECIRKYVCMFESESLGKDFNVENIVKIKNMDTRRFPLTLTMIKLHPLPISHKRQG